MLQPCGLINNRATYFLSKTWITSRSKKEKIILNGCGWLSGLKSKCVCETLFAFETIFSLLSIVCFYCCVECSLFLLNSMWKWNSLQKQKNLIRCGSDRMCVLFCAMHTCILVFIVLKICKCVVRFKTTITYCIAWFFSLHHLYLALSHSVIYCFCFFFFAVV